MEDIELEKESLEAIFTEDYEEKSPTEISIRVQNNNTTVKLHVQYKEGYPSVPPRIFLESEYAIELGFLERDLKKKMSDLADSYVVFELVTDLRERLERLSLDSGQGYFLYLARETLYNILGTLTLTELYSFMQTSRGLFEICQADFLYEKLCSTFISCLPNKSWRLSYREYKLSRRKVKYSLFPVLLAVYDRESVGERLWKTSWQETIKKELGSNYVWKRTNHFDIDNVESGVLTYTIPGLAATYEIASYSLYSAAYLETNFPSLDFPIVDDNCEFTKYNTVVGWCNLEFKHTREAECTSMIKVLATSTWGPIFYPTTKGWDRIEVLCRRDTVFVNRWTDQDRLISCKQRDSEHFQLLAPIHTARVVNASGAWRPRDKYWYANYIYEKLVQGLEGQRGVIEVSVPLWVIQVPRKQALMVVEEAKFPDNNPSLLS